MTQTDDSIYAVAEVNGSLYLARHSGLYRSPLSSVDWRNLYQSWLPNDAVPTLAIAASPHVAADGILLAGISGGIALSEDGGDTWAARHFRNPLPLVTGLALSPAFANDRTILAGTYEDGLFRSTDGGKSWQAGSFGLFDHSILCLALSPQFADDGRAFVGTGSGIYISENGGRLWHDCALPLDDAVLSLALSPDFAADRALFAGTEANGLLQSSDGGATWRVCCPMEGAVNALLLIAAGSPNHRLVALVNDSLVGSTDGGASWTSVVDGGVQALTLAADSRSILLAMADGSLQRLESNWSF